MKEKDLNTLWAVPVYLPDVQPKLTAKIIREAETKIGYKFPKEYLDILEIQNGGYIRFTLKDTPHNQILGIGEFGNSITNFEWFREYEETLSFTLDGLFPFDGDGHWNICLDYRKNKVDPEVTYIDTEIEFEKPIAGTFKEYLDLLEVAKEDRFVIETELTIEDCITKIAAVLNVQFEEPTTFHHGYKTYRSNYNDSWIWITPNKVPGGFVRESHERFEELKLVEITERLRFPELPGNYLLIDISDETECKKILNRLDQAGIIVKALKAYFEESPDR